jgi:transmembrane sensor
MDNYNELIARYCIGDCTEEECAELLAWVELSEENKQYFATINNTWILSGINENLKDYNHKANEFKYLQNIIKAIDSNRKQRRFSELRKVNSNILKIAATLIIAIGLTAFISYLFWSKPDANVAFHVLKVPSGQQAQLTLPDGTKIWLNSKSQLTYPGTFGGNTREVVLDGEAYFQVSHNPNHPFIVKTSHLDVKVLGTSFNVTSYSDDDNISLALETGSISIIKSGKEAAKLKPDEVAVYSKSRNQIKESRAELGLYTSWLNGQFKFKNLSFGDISRRLGRNFNVTFVFDRDDIKLVKYNGSFYNYESLNEILKIMQTNSSFKYKIIKNKVFIK